MILFTYQSIWWQHSPLQQSNELQRAHFATPPKRNSIFWDRVFSEISILGIMVFHQKRKTDSSDWRMRTSGRLCACNNASHAATAAEKHSRGKLCAHEWERLPDIAERSEMATRYIYCTRHISGPASLCTTMRDCMYVTAAPSSRTRASLCCVHHPTSPLVPPSPSPLFLSLIFLFLLTPPRPFATWPPKSCQDGWDMLWTLSNFILILLWAVALSFILEALKNLLKCVNFHVLSLLVF